MGPNRNATAALLRMGGEAWATQLRVMLILQRASLEQAQRFWGIGMAPDAPAAAPDETEIDDVPV